MSRAITTGEVEAVARRFLTAFDQLDWAAFSRFIAPETTVFFPFAHLPRRVAGQTEVERVFAAFFDQVRSERTGPSYLNIKPRGIDIHLLGTGAVVTFHLEDEPILSRRTAVFIRRSGAWYLLHLHASNLSQVAPTPG